MNDCTNTDASAGKATSRFSSSPFLDTFSKARCMPHAREELGTNGTQRPIHQRRENSLSNLICLSFPMPLLLIGSSILIKPISVCSPPQSYMMISEYITLDSENLSTYTFTVSNITTDNAYVSGLKEDLGFKSNELVRLQSMYVIGAVIGQLPFTFVFPMFPMNWTIPALEIGWGIFTLLQYRTESFAELMAYRFLVGLFEVSHHSSTMKGF